MKTAERLISSLSVIHVFLTVVKTALPKQNLFFISFHWQRQMVRIFFLILSLTKICSICSNLVSLGFFFQWSKTNCPRRFSVHPCKVSIIQIIFYGTVISKSRNSWYHLVLSTEYQMLQYTAALYSIFGGTLRIMLIIIRNWISDPSSNTGWSCLHFTSCRERHESISSSPS